MKPSWVREMLEETSEQKGTQFQLFYHDWNYGTHGEHVLIAPAEITKSEFTALAAQAVKDLNLSDRTDFGVIARRLVEHNGFTLLSPIQIDVDALPLDDWSPVAPGVGCMYRLLWCLQHRTSQLRSH